MLSPDMQITIYISEEVVRMIAATVGFAVAIWGMVKVIGLLVLAQEKKTGDSDSARNGNPVD